MTLHWKAQVVLAVLFVAGLVAFGWYLRSDRKSDAEVRTQLAALAVVRDSLMHRGDSLEAVQKPQTVAAAKTKIVWDSTGLRQMAKTIDSLKALGVAKPETVPVLVPLSTLQNADTAIKACTQALQTCEERVGVQRKRAETAEAANAILVAHQPSKWAPTIHRAQGGVVGLALGLLIGAVAKP